MAFEVYKVDQPRGVNFTREPSQLSAQVWDEADNVAFRHGVTKKMSGYEQGFGKTGSAGDNSVYPESMLALRDDNQQYYWWAYASGNKVLRITAKDAHVDATPTNILPSNVNYKWTGDTINAVPYFTNQIPYRWDNASSRFKKYKFWPDHVKAHAVRTYRNFHIALNISTTDFDPSNPDASWGDSIGQTTERDDYVKTFGPWLAGDHQNALWWSADVIGKDTDVVWSDADPTKPSGWNFLGGAGGPIIDGKVLRDSFMIYRERSIWQMTYVGGINVFAFKEIFTDVGCLGLDCVAEIDGWHYVVGQSDVYMHNGVQKKSIADGVVRKALFDTIDPNHIQNVYIATKYQDKELWVCVPEVGTNRDGKCNVAFVYNWEEQSWARRALPNSLCSIYTILSIASESSSWDSKDFASGVGSTWEENTATWLSVTFKYNPSQWGLAFGGSLPDGTGGAIYTSIAEPITDGENFEAEVEKKWIDMGDRTQYKTVNKVYPLVREGEVDVYMSGTSTIMEAPTWKFIGRFDPLKHMHLACHVTGRYLHTKFVIPETSRAEIRGYAVDFRKTGNR